MQQAAFYLLIRTAGTEARPTEWFSYRLLFDLARHYFLQRYSVLQSSGVNGHFSSRQTCRHHPCISGGRAFSNTHG